MMIRKIAAIAAGLWLSAGAALAQTSPNLTFGQVLTPAQWNQLFINKQDALGFTPLNSAGGVISGRLVTAPPSSTTAGLNLTPGSTPASPVNGDIWVTSAGAFVQVNGVTVPLVGGTAASITIESTNILSGTPNELLYDHAGKVGNLATLNSGVLVTSGAGVPSISTTLPSGLAATGMALTTPIVQSATPTAAGALGFNAGILNWGDGTANHVAVSTDQTQTLSNKTFIAPVLGAATGTSLALGGAALGGNLLAVNGGVLSGSITDMGLLTVNTSNASALAVGANGATNPAFLVDSSGAGQATGVKVAGFSAGTGAGILAISSGTNESLAINAKGNANLILQNVGTGSVLIDTAITYGGVTLANSVTGTGSMVLGTSPTITSLTVNTAFTATGLVTFADLATAAISTTAQYFSGTANTIVPASVIYSAETTTTFGATTTFDFSTFINTAVTLTGNTTTQTLSNVKAGQAGSITFIQDGTGSRTTVWNSIFKFAGGVTPTLSTAAGAIDVLFYSCRSATVCPASLVQNVH